MVTRFISNIFRVPKQRAKMPEKTRVNPQSQIKLAQTRKLVERQRRSHGPRLR